MKYYSHIINTCMLFVLVWMGVIACKVTGNDVGATAQTGSNDTGSQIMERDSTLHTAMEDNGPQIIFLTYSIKKDRTQGGYTIELIDEMITEGKLKMNTEDRSSPKTGDLRCIALDGNQQSVSNLIIPDPLNKIIEYMNEDGNLAKREIVLDSAQFTVRMQLHPSVKFIAVEKIDFPDRQGARLILTQINSP